MKSHNHIRALVEGAVMVALAQLLSYLTLFRMPQGGSVDLAMLPILIYAVRWGLGRGLLSGLVFGLLQYFIGNGIAISWVSMLGDYAIAFMVLGVAGIFRGSRNGILWGSLVGSLARFIVHWIVGATVWGEYMPEMFWSMPMTNTWVYSALYNLSYMLPDCVLVTVIGVILLRIIPKYIRGEDIRRD